MDLKGKPFYLIGAQAAVGAVAGMLLCWKCGLAALYGKLMEKQLR